ncbi:DUF262 domain-containing protein, partial [uncultured Thiodictyon sp.]|uniref:DUF262 domain-containing protein n=1 Tax=uncultured Thiodictyon sp. TaxID=1846217 RepID=UPI0025DD6F3F
MLNPVLFNSLPSVRDILADPDTLFVIPTFQRPYAWEQKQIRDLKDDFDSALCAQAARHYFAHVHLVPIEWHSSADFNLVISAIPQPDWWGSPRPVFRPAGIISYDRGREAANGVEWRADGSVA